MSASLSVSLGAISGASPAQLTAVLIPCRVGRCEAMTASAMGSLVPKRTLIKYAPFMSRIHQVLSLCPQKKMIGPHASRVIATMTNAQAIWYRSVRVLISKAMGVPSGALHVDLSHKGAVAVRLYCALPKPAAVGLLHHRPEALTSRASRIFPHGIKSNTCLTTTQRSDGAPR